MIANLLVLATLAVVTFLGAAAISGARETVRQNAKAGDEPNLPRRVAARIVAVCIGLVLVVAWIVGLGVVIA